MSGAGAHNLLGAASGGGTTQSKGIKIVGDATRNDVSLSTNICTYT